MAFWSSWFKNKANSPKLLASAGASGGQQLVWNSQSLSRYADSSDEFDPDLSAIELPLFGVPPPKLVSAISATLNQLEQGTFYQAAYLWDGMLRDDRMTATVNVRLNGLFGAPLELEEGTDTAKGRKARDIVKDARERMLPTHQLMHLQRYALGLSVGIAQVLTERDAKSTKPTFKVWNPRYLRFDWTIRKYCLVTENRGEIVLDYGDPEWIIWEPFGPQGWLHGALIRSLAQPWLIRYWTRTWWSRYQEVHGMPIRAGIIPADRKPKDEALFLSQLSNLAHEAVVRLPQGQDGNRFDLKLVEAESNNWQGFEKLLEHCDDSIAIVLLGQRQSTMGQGGLGSQEKAGDSTMLRLLRGDALIGDCLREQYLKKWAVDNFGDEDVAPKLHWEIDPPEDLDKKATTLLNVAKALQVFTALPAASQHVDIRQLCEDNELPLLSEEVVKTNADAAKLAAQTIGNTDEAASKPGKQPAKQAGNAPNVDENGNETDVDL